jgi:hypothetical protein
MKIFSSIKNLNYAISANLYTLNIYSYKLSKFCTDANKDKDKKNDVIIKEDSKEVVENLSKFK